jgi:transglutaminase-like putative cysteine protease
MIRSETIKFFAVLLMVSIGGVSLFAQNIESYPVDCQYDSVFVNIKSNYTAEIIYKQKYLFNQARVSDYSTVKVPVNKYIDFSLIEIMTVLPDGRQIKFDSKDIETISDFSPQYYPDSKSVIIHIPSPRAGAAAVIAYKLSYKSLLYLPQFFRQRDVPTSSSYLEVSSEIPYTFYATDDIYQVQPESSKSIFYSENIPAIKYESHMPPNSDYHIVVKPDSVIYERKKYGFDSWSDVALFYNELSRSDDLVDNDNAIKTLAANIVANSTNELDSLRALLDYVRDNIRYISVNIGRGEFKPLKPVEVLNKKYGDCKDQSALLTALCRSVGFDANPALVTTRDKPDVILSLPWPGYFNHVITAVDTGDGYLFLDASQATCCFGSLPPNLRNRRALICGNSPFLEFTLTSPLELGNDIDINLLYEIGKGGDIRIEVDLKLYRDPAFMFYAASDKRVLTDVLYSFLGDEISSQYRTSFKIIDKAPDFIRVSGFYFEKLPSIPAGNRLLINTHSPFLKFIKNYFQYSGRTNSYNFDYTFNVNESINLELGGYYTAPKDSIALAFNERGLQAHQTLISKGNSCEIDKSFKLFDYTLTADRYNSFSDFLLIISQIPYNSSEVVPVDSKHEENHLE